MYYQRDLTVKTNTEQIIVPFCAPSELSAKRLKNPQPEKNNENIVLFTNSVIKSRQILQNFKAILFEPSVVGAALF